MFIQVSNLFSVTPCPPDMEFLVNIKSWCLVYLVLDETLNCRQNASEKLNQFESPSFVRSPANIETASFYLKHLIFNHGHINVLWSKQRNRGDHFHSWWYFCWYLQNDCECLVLVWGALQCRGKSLGDILLKFFWPNFSQFITWNVENRWS